MRLYHFTCSHGAERIDAEGLLKPQPMLLLFETSLVWLTDLDSANPEALGLTSHILDCDRTERRYEVETEFGIPWVEWVRSHRVPAQTRAILEVEGTLPLHWYVSEVPLRVEAAA